MIIIVVRNLEWPGQKRKRNIEIRVNIVELGTSQCQG